MLFFLISYVVILNLSWITHRSKRECVIIMFYIVYDSMCLQHRLDNSVPCGQPFCFYDTNGLDYFLPLQSVCDRAVLGECGNGKRLVQIFEVITTAQGYLIHKTLFPSITGANQLILVLCQSSPSQFSWSCFSSLVQLRKMFWSRSCYLRPRIQNS